MAESNVEQSPEVAALRQLAQSLKVAHEAARQLDALREGNGGYTGAIQDLLADAEWELSKPARDKDRKPWWQ